MAPGGGRPDRALARRDQARRLPRLVPTSRPRRGPSPSSIRDRYLEGETDRSLPEDIRDGIAAHGIRNALLTSIAPTGTISLFAGNLSSGIEPVFAMSYTRKVTQRDGTKTDRDGRGLRRRPLPPPVRRGGPPARLLRRRAAPHARGPSQPCRRRRRNYIDSAISKTINVPADIPFEAFKDVYARAYDQGCKGCTTYRPNAVTGSVLSVQDAGSARGGPPGAASEPGEVIRLSDPLERPESLVGTTYKLKWPDSPHAIYVTLNDIETAGGGAPSRSSSTPRTWSITPGPWRSRA